MLGARSRAMPLLLIHIKVRSIARERAPKGGVTEQGRECC